MNAVFRLKRAFARCIGTQRLCGILQEKRRGMAAPRIFIGTEFFREIRENGFYYADKTGIIEELLLLMDKYDVPLAKAQVYGYYKEMVAFIRAFLGGTLKTSPYLQLAVLTGCLRI